MKAHPSEPELSIRYRDLDLGIVIVSWNTRDLLSRCLASLGAATAGLNAKTVVVDNASADGTPAMVRREYPDVTLVDSGANIGFAAACNRGAATLAAEATLFLNPDTECPPGALKKLVDRSKWRTDAGVVTPALVDGEGRGTASYGYFPRARHHIGAALDPGGRWLPARWRGGLGCVVSPSDDESPVVARPCQAVDYVKGACFLVNRRAWEEVGEFDERFFLYFEETDWCRRARDCGWRAYVCPDVQVRHQESGAAEQVSDFALAMFQESYRRYVAKHYGRQAVAALRAAQICEFGVKSVLRSCVAWRSPQDRELARRHRRRLALQFRPRITARPPAQA